MESNKYQKLLEIEKEIVCEVAQGTKSTVPITQRVNGRGREEKENNGSPSGLPQVWQRDKTETGLI